jgi:hypothetical protein
MMSVRFCFPLQPLPISDRFDLSSFPYRGKNPAASSQVSLHRCTIICRGIFRKRHNMHVAIRYKSRAYFPPLQLCYNTAAPSMLYIKGTHSHAFHYLHGNDAKAHIFLSYIRVVGITVLQYTAAENQIRERALYQSQ